MPEWNAPDGQVEIDFRTGEPSLTRRLGSDHWQRQPQAFVLPMHCGALRIDSVVASVLLRRPMGPLRDALTPLRDLK